MTQQRYNWVDWAKAIAIYAVVLGHITNSTNPYWVQYISRIGCIFHLPVFFFISGYLFIIKEDSFWEFTKKSAQMLLIPYIFFNIVSGIVLYRLQAPDVWNEGLRCFFTCESHAFSGPCWFLISLFIIRLLTYGTEYIKRKRTVALIVLIITILATVIPFKIVFGITSAFMAWIFFCVGTWRKKRIL